MPLPRHQNTDKTRFLIQDRSLFLDAFDGTEYEWTAHRGVAWALRHDEALLHLRAIKRHHPTAKIVRR